MANWEDALGGVRRGVTGVGLGDPMEWLPLELATRVWPLTPSMRRKFEFRDPTHELSRTGQWVDVPPAQLLVELRRYGGSLTFGDRTFAIADGRVHAIQMRPDALSQPFVAEADIEARLGPPSLVTGTGGASVVRFYSETSLTLVWRAAENRLDHVTVGPNHPLPRLLTRVAVLQTWLGTVDHLKDWQPGDPSVSTAIRHKRLTALLGAFGLGSPEEFARGHFLKEPLERYPLSLAALRESRPSDGEHARFAVAFGLDELQHLFWRLLGYRRAASRLPEVSSYDEAGSPGALTVIRMTGELNRHVAGGMTDIDDVLLEMISPSDEIFSEEELVSRWGYVKDRELYEAISDEW